MRTLVKVLAVAGARPNFMKTAPILTELGRRAERFESVLVHTAGRVLDVLEHEPAWEDGSLAVRPAAA